MNNSLYFIFSILILCACNNSHNDKNENVIQKNGKNFENIKNGKIDENIENRLRKEVISSLLIPVNEKFNFEIKFEHLNSDDKKDAIILVNRLNFAINEASKSNNPAKIAELGYLGAHNYFFYFDGKTKKLSIPIVIGSSAKAPLKVIFENIQSEFYKDIIIEYRIRNSAFRNYYLLKDLTLQLIFQWKLYDLLGTPNNESVFIEYKDGTLNLVKDILIYKGKIKNHKLNIENVYTFKPEIVSTNELKYRFFFDQNQSKYFTKDKPKNELQ
jgi:hypothetical protein